MGNTNMRNWGLTLGTIGILIAAIVVVGILTNGDEPRAETPTQSPEITATPRARATPTERQASSYNVIYRVSTSDSSRIPISLTYENQSGNTEQLDSSITGIRNWEETFRGEPGGFLYVSVQSNHESAKSITCEILVNGQVVESATSQGRFVIATCSGRIPG